MNKTEVIQIVIIILAINIIVQSIIMLSEQSSFLFGVQADFPIDKTYLFILLFGVILLFGIAGFLFYKSKLIAHFIIKEDKELNIYIEKSEIINIALIIMCVYFLITLFLSAINSVYQLALLFLDDFTQFKDIYPQQIGMVILYFSLFFILRNSSSISKWLTQTTENNLSKSDRD